MRAHDLALAHGISETRTTLARWRDGRWRIVGTWATWSALVAAALLAAVYAIAELSVADPSGVPLPAGGTETGLGAMAEIMLSNLTVLALHALACVAGFIAGSSLPRSARAHRGLLRRVHERAGPLAIGFVVLATAFSLFTQAYVLGGWASTIAAQLALTPATLMLGILPHALPELVALFLPLAAWVVASRSGDWHELLAATCVTVAIAVPALVLTATLEVYVTPQLLAALA